jgi:hypothetical protein
VWISCKNRILHPVPFVFPFVFAVGLGVVFLCWLFFWIFVLRVGLGSSFSDRLWSFVSGSRFQVPASISILVFATAGLVPLDCTCRSHKPLVWILLA